METIVITSTSKKDLYLELLPQIRALIEDETDLIANLANVTAALKSAFSYYSWVGFYLKKNDELVLGPFQGKIACVRIKIGSGVCGTAAQKKETMIVPDVNQFDGHIACDPDSRSEIVVPIIQENKLLGVLDVDSDSTSNFDTTDKTNLEKLVEFILPKF